MKTNKQIIIDFIFKYFFILKAASLGWTVTYLGANKFDFGHSYKKKIDFQKFINNYTEKFNLIYK